MEVLNNPIILVTATAIVTAGAVAIGTGCFGTRGGSKASTDGTSDNKDKKKGGKTNAPVAAVPAAAGPAQAQGKKAAQPAVPTPAPAAKAAPQQPQQQDKKATASPAPAQAAPADKASDKAAKASDKKSQQQQQGKQAAKPAAAAAAGTASPKPAAASPKPAASSAAAAAAAAPAYNPAPVVSAAVLAAQRAEEARFAALNEGWTEVVDKRSGKKKGGAAAPAAGAASPKAEEAKAPVAAPAPVSASVSASSPTPSEDHVSSSIDVVNQAQFRSILGEAGKTLERIRAAAGGCAIRLPRLVDAPERKEKGPASPTADGAAAAAGAPAAPAEKAKPSFKGPALRVSNTIELKGTAEQVAAAKAILHELIHRGYSKTLDPTYGESQIEVPEARRFAIIGPEGRYLRAIQTETQTSIAIPERDSGARFTRITGPQDGVKRARAALEQLLRYEYSAITHPGWENAFTAFPSALHGRLVGTRGARIQALQRELGVRLVLGVPSAEKVTVSGPRGAIGPALDKLKALAVELADAAQPAQPEAAAEDEIDPDSVEAAVANW